MKICIIPDVHGRFEMLEYDFKNYDKIIFLGDIFDSFTKTMYSQVDAFSKIKKLQEEYKENFIWILGNHDVHYIDNTFLASGYQETYASIYKHLLNSCKDYFYNFYVIDNYIFSHAGIVNRLLKNVGKSIEDLQEHCKWDKRIPEFMNIGKKRGGDAKFPGLFWADFAELNSDPIPNYIQVVGHTEINKPFIRTYKNKNSKNIFVDTGKIFTIEI